MIESVRVHHATVPIKQVSSLYHPNTGEPLLGLFDDQHRLISLETDMDESVKVDVLVHELAHAYIEMAGKEASEEDVQFLANTIIDCVLYNRPLLYLLYNIYKRENV